MVSQAAARAAEEVLLRRAAEPEGDVERGFHGHLLSLDDGNPGSVRRSARLVNLTLWPRDYAPSFALNVETALRHR